MSWQHFKYTLPHRQRKLQVSVYVLAKLFWLDAPPWDTADAEITSPMLWIRSLSKDFSYFTHRRHNGSIGTWNDLWKSIRKCFGRWLRWWLSSHFGTRFFSCRDAFLLALVSLCTLISSSCDTYDGCKQQLKGRGKVVGGVGVGILNYTWNIYI